MGVAPVTDAAVRPALALWCMVVPLCLGLLKHTALGLHVGCHLCAGEYSHKSCALQDMSFSNARVVYVLQCCCQEGAWC
jgi:hypothetical protein